MRADSYGSILRAGETGWGATERNSIIHLQNVWACALWQKRTWSTHSPGLEKGERQQGCAWLGSKSESVCMCDWWSIFKWDLPLRMCFCTDNLCVQGGCVFVGAFSSARTADLCSKWSRCSYIPCQAAKQSPALGDLRETTQHTATSFRCAAKKIKKTLSIKCYAECISPVYWR